LCSGLEERPWKVRGGVAIGDLLLRRGAAPRGAFFSCGLIVEEDVLEASETI